MKNNKSILLVTLFVLFLNNCISAQISEFKYKRKINKPTETFHRIEIPDDLFSKIKNDLSDIRIIGFNEMGDTLEVPYLIKINEEKYQSEEIEFRTLNESRKENGFYYTFELSEKNNINEINLEFKSDNFDIMTDLEGSNDLNEWFLIKKDSRLISIKNEHTYYKYSKLIFPESKYRYFRIFIKSDLSPHLFNASIYRKNKIEGKLREYPKFNYILKEDNILKKSIIEIELNDKVPISKFKLNIDNNYDYYRTIRVFTKIDSIKTANGYYINYEKIFDGILSSFEKSEIKIPNVISDKIKIEVSNNDNEPLTITGIEISGYTYGLICRFVEEADYYIYYSNIKASEPIYDLLNFLEKLPSNPSILNINSEIINIKTEIKEKGFVSTTWLWIIMVIIIISLGYASLKMLKKKL